MVTTKQLHELFNILEQNDTVEKPYQVVTVKSAGDALDVMTNKHNLRVFIEEEKVVEL